MQSKIISGTVQTAMPASENQAQADLDEDFDSMHEGDPGNLFTSGFFSDLTHEIRTPMNGVIGMLELLQNSNLTPEQRGYTTAAIASADQLLSLVNNVLDLSLIEADAINLQHRPFDLRRELDAAFRASAANAHIKGIKLETQYALTTHTWMIGDPDRLRQIVTNLVNHAIRSTAQGPLIVDVETTVGDRNNCQLLLTVTDASPASAEKFPAPFDTQGKPVVPRIRQFDNAELGLALSKRLVEAMGGAVGVHHQRGHGSAFWFTLDLEQAQSPLADMRILLVDDRPYNGSMLQSQLTAYKMRTDGFATAAEAISALSSAAADGDPYRVVIIDHQMRGVGGELFGAALKGDTAHADTVMILLSSADPQDAERFASAGFSAFISKPADARMLFDTIAILSRAIDNNECPPFVTNGLLATNIEPLRPFEGYRILVADDGTINQQVAARMLENFGCQVDIAINGVQAVTMHAEHNYDLILMDCEMPELDGYQATRHIRAAEKSTRRTPILAWTACAAQGEEEKCLEAGMDEFMTKPMRRQALRETLGRWLQPVAGNATEELPLDDELDAVMEMFGDSFAELVALFRTDSPKRIVALHVAAAEDEAGQVAKIAHALSGSTASIGATGLAAQCRDLEVCAKLGIPKDIDARLESIEKEYARVDAKLQSMLVSDSD